MTHSTASNATSYMTQTSEAALQASRRSMKLKLDKFEEFLNGEIEAPEWDSDNELPPLEIDSTVEILGYTGQSWEKAKILQKIENLLFLEYRNFNEFGYKWMDNYADEVALEGTKVRPSSSLL